MDPQSTAPPIPAQPVVQQPSQTPIPMGTPPSFPQTTQPISQTPINVPKKNNSLATWLIVIGMIFIGVISFGIYYLSQQNVIVVADQPFGDSIHIKKLTVRRPGYLVISRLSPSTGIGMVVGTPYIQKENYLDFDLHVGADSMKVLSPGDKFFGSMYEDGNGNGAYDDGVDEEMTDIFGRTNRAYFTLQ